MHVHTLSHEKSYGPFKGGLLLLPSIIVHHYSGLSWLWLSCPPRGQSFVQAEFLLYGLLAASKPTSYHIYSTNSGVTSRAWALPTQVPGGGELVDRVFGLRVREGVHCGACGRDTHASEYVQFFYNVSATALRIQALADAAEGDDPARPPPLGALLGVCPPRPYKPSKP